MLLNQKQLFEYSECGQKATLIDWLRENGIRYTLTRKGRVVSTLQQINNALAENDDEDDYEFGQE